jgi:hypothetical protein
MKWGDSNVRILGSVEEGRIPKVVTSAIVCAARLKKKAMQTDFSLAAIYSNAEGCLMTLRDCFTANCGIPFRLARSGLRIKSFQVVRSTADRFD